MRHTCDHHAPCSASSHGYHNPPTPTFHPPTYMFKLEQQQCDYTFQPNLVEFTHVGLEGTWCLVPGAWCLVPGTEYCTIIIT